jgi:predicted acyltransferase
MATLAQPTQAATTPSREQQAGGRLLSLDAFRGLTMLLLISHGFGIHEAFKDKPDWAWLAAQFDHVAWVGCVLWDLIQPAFTFIVGVAMPFSFARRMQLGATRSQLMQHVAWRALILIVLSNVLSNWGSTKGLQLQFINVLCQIAFSYVLCALIWQLRFRWQVVAAAGLFLFHHALFVLFPGPQGAFSQTGNVGQVIDQHLLGYNYSGYYTTINFLGNALTVLFGVWTGMLMQSHRSHAERVRILGACAAACFALGLALAPFIPMVKRLWLGSFTFWSTGWVLLGLMACYWAVEMRGWRKWAWPAMVVGMNCIFIYSFSQVLRGWLSRGLSAFTGNFSWMGSYGAIPHNLVVMAAMWYLCYWLYQRRIFFKI